MTIPDRPRTPHALHAWIAATLGVRLARTPLIHGHNAPFDYILHTFFEGLPIRAEESEPAPEASAEGANADGFPPSPRAGSAERGEGRVRGSPSGRPSRGSERPGESPIAPTHLDSPHVSNGRLPHPLPPPSVAPLLPPDIVLWANRGGGKTFLGAIATVLDMLFKPAIQVRILAGSLEQASRMLDHLRHFFSLPDLAPLVAGKITQRRIALTNESAVEILAASEASVRGTRVQKLRCDEVDLFDPDLWHAAQLTTRSATCGDLHVRGAVECLSTMHRPHGLMFRLVKDCAAGTRRLLKWGVIDTLETCPPTRPCSTPDADCPLLPECAGRAKRPLTGTGFQPVPPAQPASDQPGAPSQAPIDPPTTTTSDRSRDLLHPDPGHISIDDAITMKSRVSLPVWEAEMLCLRPSRATTVFPEFDPDIHVVSATPAQPRRWVAGMDFGFRAPTVILWGAIGDDDTLWIADEHVRTQTTLDQHIHAILDAPDQRGIPLPSLLGVDPAGLQRHEQTGISNIDALRRAGLPVAFRSLSMGQGLELVRRRLRPAIGPPRLLIHRRCPRLIESLTCYRYPDDPESLTPLKDGHDHAVDALRYLIACLDKPHRLRAGAYLNGA